MTRHDQVAIARLLEHRYGDGTIYLLSRSDRLTFEQALELGYIGDDGQITPDGHRFLQREAPSLD